MATKPKTGAKPGSKPTGSGQRTSSKARASRPPIRRRSGHAGLFVAIGVAVVVVVLAIVAIVVTQSGGASAGLQTYPVQVTGTPLASQPDSSTPDPAVGQTPPTLTGQSLFDGSAMTVIPGGGTPQLIVFVAHWCPHCQREVPVLVQWMASDQKPADLQVTAVSTSYDTSSVNTPASAWLKKDKWPTAVMGDSSDNTAAEAYGLTSFPYLVVLGPDGALKGRTSGELTPAQLTAFVNKALST